MDPQWVKEKINTLLKRMGLLWPHRIDDPAVHSVRDSVPTGSVLKTVVGNRVEFGEVMADEVVVDASGFTGNLSGTDTNVQKALDTIDGLTIGTGDVVGPAGAVNEDIAVYDGVTGLIIKDGGKKIADLEVAGTAAAAVSSHEGTYAHGDIASNSAHRTTVTGNPHAVTKADVGLGSVTNDAQLKAASNLSDVASASTSWSNLGGANTGQVKGKFDATTAPTASDDSTGGYAAGSLWVDVTADKAYVCLDPSAGAAVWTEITQSGGGAGALLAVNNLSDVSSAAAAWANLGGANTGTIKGKFNAATGPTVNDDDTAGYLPGSLWVDLAADKAYVCVDQSTGAAVWVEITQSGGGAGALLAANNLSDVSSASTSRSNLGLGDSSTKNVGVASGTVAAGDHDHEGVYQPFRCRSRQAVCETEFYGKISLNNPPWAMQGAAGGSMTTRPPEANHPGIQYVRSGTSNNSGARFVVTDLSVEFFGGERCELVFRPTYTTSLLLKLGWYDKYGTTAVVVGAWIKLSGSTLSGELAESTGPSTESTASTYSVSDDEWYRAVVHVRADLSGVDFYLYAEDGTLLWNDACTSAIPPVGDRMDFGVDVYCPSPAATYRELVDLDYMVFYNTEELVR